MDRNHPGDPPFEENKGSENKGSENKALGSTDFQGSPYQEQTRNKFS